MRPDLKVDRYTRLLERWHGFEQAWGPAADRAIGYLLPEGFLARRKRLPMLNADLLSLGRTQQQIDALPVFPSSLLNWNDRSVALGTLYVIEGSTLGGQHVAKFIHARLGLTPQHGIAYFSSYGSEVGVRWRETKALLDAPPFPVNEDVVVESAIATFDLLGGWLSSPLAVS
jgi:heme oxygenase